MDAGVGVYVTVGVKVSVGVSVAVGLGEQVGVRVFVAVYVGVGGSPSVPSLRTRWAKRSVSLSCRASFQAMTASSQQSEIMKGLYWEPMALQTAIPFTGSKNTLTHRLLQTADKCVSVSLSNRAGCVDIEKNP